jgi:hypothetical protein
MSPPNWMNITHLVFNESAAFKQDLVYYPDLRERHGGKPTQKKSAVECQWACIRNRYCYHFWFAKTEGICHLQGFSVKNKTSLGVVAGPRYDTSIPRFQGSQHCRDMCDQTKSCNRAIYDRKIGWCGLSHIDGKPTSRGRNWYANTYWKHGQFDIGLVQVDSDDTLAEAEAVNDIQLETAAELVEEDNSLDDDDDHRHDNHEDHTDDCGGPLYPEFTQVTLESLLQNTSTLATSPRWRSLADISRHVQAPDTKVRRRRRLFAVDAPHQHHQLLMGILPLCVGVEELHQHRQLQMGMFALRVAAEEVHQAMCLFAEGE